MLFSNLAIHEFNIHWCHMHNESSVDTKLVGQATDVHVTPMGVELMDHKISNFLSDALPSQH